MRQGPRVAVIGLDCGTPQLLFRDLAAEVPNISRLLASGMYGDLASITPPITVPAWACAMTGKTPGQLGIYGFRNRKDHTYDGLSIAWAVVEHLHRDAERGPRTLFATHYQELTQLEKHLPRLRNLSVAVKEWNDEIVFVRRVVPGAADRSYGIQVARLAGLPLTVINRARTILSKLESEESTVTVAAPAPSARPKKKISVTPTDDSQLDLL